MVLSKSLPFIAKGGFFYGKALAFIQNSTEGLK